MSFTTLYMHNAASGLTVKPSGYLGTYDLAGSANIGKSATATTGTPLATLNETASPQTKSTTWDIAAAQFLSPPLAAQSIASGNWTVAFATKQTGGASTVYTTGTIAIYLVDGATGAIRDTIVAKSAIGTQAATSSSVRTRYGTAVAGSAVIAQSGDYIAVELGERSQSTASSNLTVTHSVLVDGTTAITTNNVTTVTSPRSLVTAPGTIYAQGDTVPGGSTSTLSGSATADAPTGGGTGLAASPPTMTLGGAALVAAPTGSGAGLAYTPPAATVYTLSGGGTAGAPSGGGAGLTATPPAFTLSGTGTATAPTGSGAGLSATPPQYALSGAGTAQPATGAGAGLSAAPPSYTLSGAAIASGPTGSGTGLTSGTPPATLSGSATAGDATGTGPGLVASGPAFTLSGQAAQQPATGSGTGLIGAVPTFTLGGTASPSAPSGGGVGLVATVPAFALNGGGIADSPSGSGPGLVAVVPTFIIGGGGVASAPAGSGVGLLYLPDTRIPLARRFVAGARDLGVLAPARPTLHHATDRAPNVESNPRAMTTIATPRPLTMTGKE